MEARRVEGGKWEGGGNERHHLQYARDRGAVAHRILINDFARQIRSHLKLAVTAPAEIEASASVPSSIHSQQHSTPRLSSSRVCL